MAVKRPMTSTRRTTAWNRRRMDQTHATGRSHGLAGRSKTRNRVVETAGWHRQVKEAMRIRKTVSRWAAMTMAVELGDDLLRWAW